MLIVRKLLYLLWLLLLVGVGLMLGILNKDQVNVDLLFATVNQPLGVVLAVFLLFGLVSGLLLSWFLRLTRRR
ncbi:MAG: LapA family protein [bacterium]